MELGMTRLTGNTYNAYAEVRLIFIVNEGV